MAGLPNGNGICNNVNVNAPYIKIIEQPASKALRFRYECEGRSAGSIPGIHNTPENKTYPTIQIVGYKGRAVIVVSCVTKDEPYRAHPHNLVGKEGCKNGICTMEINNDSMTATFSNLGIQCVKRKDIEEALKIRQEIRVDPFRQGFTHSAHPSSIDLNAVRLCFQAFLGELKQKYEVLTPVVSDPIYDKKAMSDLVITRLSHSSASVKGGQDVILLCEKVAKEDIQIRFSEESNSQVVWEGFADFTPAQVHKQVAIYFKTPAYKITEVDRKVAVFIQLRRPSDGATSEPLPFHFTPDESARPGTKRPKITHDYSASSFQSNQLTATSSMCRVSPHSQQPIDSYYRGSPQPMTFQPVKEEPCPSPELPFRTSPAPRSPYNNQNVSPSRYTPQYVNYVPDNAQLPPFDDLASSRMKFDQQHQQQQLAGNFEYINNLNYTKNYPTNNLNVPQSLDTYFANGMNGGATSAAAVMMEAVQSSTMFATTNGPINETLNRNEGATLSLDKLDSTDLVHNIDENECMDAANLSANMLQSLNISDYANSETNNNMTDSLTRLANETADKLCNRG